MMSPAPAVARAVAVTALSLFIVPAVVSAHAQVQAGSLSMEVGWQREPAYVGQMNAVEVFVNDEAGAPITDLTADELLVTVTFGDQTSDPFLLVPSYDADTGLGRPGELLAPLIPTAPGDYTFHVTGAVHGMPVDVSVTSGKTTFDSVVGPAAIEFPTAVPTLADIEARLERLEAAIGPGSSPQPAP
jgi:hypothetical protein